MNQCTWVLTNQYVLLVQIYTSEIHFHLRHSESLLTLPKKTCYICNFEENMKSPLKIKPDLSRAPSSIVNCSSSQNILSYIQKLNKKGHSLALNKNVKTFKVISFTIQIQSRKQYLCWFQVPAIKTTHIDCQIIWK